MRLGMVLALTLLAPSAAHAHSLAFGVLRVAEEPDGARVILRAGGREGVPPTLALEVRGCSLRAGSPSYEEAQLVLHGRLGCPTGLSGARLRLHGLDEELRIAVRIERLDGSVQAELLDAAQPEVLVAAPPPALDVARRYGALGTEHILLGLDHLLFLLVLLLAASHGARPLPAAVRAVTGFTLGHSVTLSLAALGAISLRPAPVEVCIALSIVLLAAELVRGRPTGATLQRPGAVAAAFGLLHGLGFAGALAEHGLPAGQRVLALASFNVGVELGQLGFVLALVPLLAWARARPVGARAARWAAAAVGVAGAIWLGARLDALSA